MKPNKPIEPQPPAELAPFQATFGQAIATPFGRGSGEQGMFKLLKDRYPAAIVALIEEQPQRNLDAHARLATYNQQYWFRLITVMQKEYPLLLALMGLTDFNRMTIDYIDAYPPSSPSLGDLSNHLISFLSQSQDWPGETLLQAARLEFDFIQSFDAADAPPLNPTLLDESRLLEEPLALQAHVRLFHEDWNLVYWRGQVKASAEPEEVKVELEPGQRNWLIYRSPAGTETRPLGILQYRLLLEIANGHAIQEAIALTCEQGDEDDLKFMDEHLSSWFAEWVALGLFAHPQP